MDGKNIIRKDVIENGNEYGRSTSNWSYAT
jgi:hypothetical protein